MRVERTEDECSWMVGREEGWEGGRGSSRIAGYWFVKSGGRAAKWAGWR